MTLRYSPIRYRPQRSSLMKQLLSVLLMLAVGLNCGMAVQAALCDATNPCTSITYPLTTRTYYYPGAVVQETIAPNSYYNLPASVSPGQITVPPMAGGVYPVYGVVGYPTSTTVIQSNTTVIGPPNGTFTIQQQTLTPTLIHTPTHSVPYTPIMVPTQPITIPTPGQSINPILNPRY